MDLKLHPGLGPALRKFDQDETQLARSVASGELASPQKFANSWYFRIRLSGTGLSYRPALKEYVERLPEHYLEPDTPELPSFAARCNGLPVIWVHPDKMVLDTEEFARRVVGTVVLPYVGGPDGEDPDAREVWGVARIIDADAARQMRENKLSTSPAVELPPEGNERVPAGDGKHLLIENRPKFVDHIAIVPEGVWDKMGLAGRGVDDGELKADAAFVESEHPRDEDGKFAESGGSGSLGSADKEPEWKQQLAALLQAEENKKNPKIFYHGTAEQYLSSIKRDGIVVRENKNWSGGLYEGDRGEAIYLTSDLVDAKSYALSAAKMVKEPPFDVRPIVLRIEIPEEERAKLSKDIVAGHELKDAFKFPKEIRPEWITGVSEYDFDSEKMKEFKSDVAGSGSGFVVVLAGARHRADATQIHQAVLDGVRHASIKQHVLAGVRDGASRH